MSDLIQTLGERHELDIYAEEMATKLKALFPQKFGKLNLERIAFVRRMGKASQAEIPTLARVVPVKQPNRAFSTKDYLVVTMGDTFGCLPLHVKQKVIAHELCHVPIDLDEKAITHDVVDFRFCIEQFGFNWNSQGDGDPLFEQDENDPLYTPGEDD